MNYLSKDNNITIISNEFNVMNVPNNNNSPYEIRSFTTKKQVRRNIIEYKINKSKITKRFYMIILFFHKLYYLFKIFFKSTTIFDDLIKGYINELNNVNGSIDIIIPVCNPFESLVAAFNFKCTEGNKIEIVPYLFDRFTHNKATQWTALNRLFKKRNNLRLERKILSNSKRIIVNDSWVNHIEKYFPQLANKMIHVEHPLLINYYSKNLSEENILKPLESFSILYAGGLDRKIRNPKYTFKLFIKLLQEHNNISLNLYIKGNYKDYVDRLKHKNKLINLNNFGLVSSKEIEQQIRESSYLLLIGNNDLSQLQSKVYEYVSSGKPIIYISKSYKDPIFNILKQYQNYCVIFESRKQFFKNIDIIMTFITTTKNEKVPFEIVKKCFIESTPEYVANKILKELYKGEFSI